MDGLMNLLRPEALGLKGTDAMLQKYRFLQFRHSLAEAHTYASFAALRGLLSLCQSTHG
jgi:hypothetical protein